MHSFVIFRLHIKSLDAYGLNGYLDNKFNDLYLQYECKDVWFLSLLL